MSIVAIVSLALALATGAAVIAGAAQIWLLAGDPERPVGPWSQPGREPPRPPALPRDLRSLVWGESGGWLQVEQWELLVRRLNAIDAELGGAVPPPPAPLQYSPTWLEQRLQSLELLSGPLPSPLKSTLPPPRRPTRKLK